jgi:hypothetical protein
LPEHAANPISWVGSARFSGHRGHFFGRNARHERFAMAQPLSTSHPLTATAPAGRGAVRAVAAAGGLIGAALVLGTLALWLHYGTAVFFDTISSGIAACL